MTGTDNLQATALRNQICNGDPEHGPCTFHVPRLHLYVRKKFLEVRVEDLVDWILHRTFPVHPHYPFGLTTSVQQSSLLMTALFLSFSKCPRHTAAGLYMTKLIICL